MRVLIVDDHPIMRLGVRQMISAAWPDAEVAEAETLGDALTQVAAARFDAVVLDLSLPDTSGSEGVVRMLRAAKGAPVLILSQSEESMHASRLLQMGVSGYLAKDRAAQELVLAIERLLRGGRYVSAALTENLLGLLDGKPVTQLPHETLSTQEFRVMQLIAAGRTPAEIAETMHLSVKTVGSYRARILEKGGWKNNIELTKYCLQHALTGHA